MIFYASRLLKDNDAAWWEFLYNILGRKMLHHWSWEVFVRRLKEKFCPPKDIKKLQEEFSHLRKVI